MLYLILLKNYLQILEVSSSAVVDNTASPAHNQVYVAFAFKFLEDMKRVGAMDFMEIEGSEYSEGSGETSEDLEIQESQKTGQNQAFVAPTPSYHMPVEYHLRNIDTSVVERSTVISTDFFGDESFDLTQLNKTFVSKVTDQVEPTEYVILNIAHPSMYQKPTTEYAKSLDFYLNWTSVKGCSTSEFSTIVHTSYKNEYQKYRHQLRFVHLVSPSTDKMAGLANQRKEAPLGRILFHHVGYGYPTNERAKIYTCDGRPPTLKTYSIKKVMDSLKTPLWFIFDCDNAGAFIPKIQRHSKTLKTNRSAESSRKRSMFNRVVNWDDWYCMCSTAAEETLPNEPLLPRDFLSTCLLTPVPLAVLCHILKYYRTSFQNPTFPLSYLQTALAGPKHLSELLETLTDSIAADYLDTDAFIRLFRKDKFLATFYRHFVLAQYLLRPYEVHPVSHPEIPVMVRHPLWHQLDSAIDLWITSNLTPMPSVIRTFYERIISSFDTMMQNKQTLSIKASMLTALCHIPLVGNGKYDHALVSLARYASESMENRIKVTTGVWIQAFFAKLGEGIKDIKNFDSLCYLILSLIQLDMDCLRLIKKDTELTKLYDMAFDMSIDEKTRVYIAAILCAVVQNMRTIHGLLSTKKFLSILKSLIPKASAPYLLWLLILFKRTHDISSCDLSLFYEDSVHIQVAELVFHNSHECRAAAISCLSCFVQPTENDVNLQLLFVAIPAFNDVSYLVRYQLLIYMTRFLSSHVDSFRASTQKIRIQTQTTFASIISAGLSWEVFWPDIESKFGEYVGACDAICRQMDATSHVCNLVFYMIDLFTHDPHPAIRRDASKAKAMFGRLRGTGLGKSSASSSLSISPPFGSPLQSSSQGSTTSESSESNEDKPPVLFETDSTALLSICLRRLVDGKGLGISEQAKPPHKASNMGQVMIPGAHLQIRASNKQLEQAPVKLAHHSVNQSLAVGTTQRWVYYMDEDLNTKHQIHVDYDISDLKVVDWEGTTYVVTMTADGCGGVWKPGNKSMSAIWRTDANYICANLPQLAATANNYHFVATVRGNGGVALWDMETLKLAGEWNFHESNIASALCLHPGNPQIVMAGYSNGSVVAFDMRINGSNDKSKILSASLGDRVVGISGNRNGGDWLYAASSSGKCVLWNAATNSIANAFNTKTAMEHFDVHSGLPIFAYSGARDQTVLCNTSGNTLFTTKGTDPGSIFLFHPILPVITFGSPGGIQSYNVVLCADVSGQK